MTLTVVATVEMHANPTRVRLDVDTTLGGRRAVAINRVHPDGSRWPVMGDARLLAGSWVGFDYLAPASQPVRYEAKGGVGIGAELATSNTVVQLSSKVRLQHPADPSLSLTALFVPEGGLGDPGNESKAGIFDTLGNDYAIAVTDRTVRRTSSISLAFTPAQAVQGGAIERLLRDGGPLLINAPQRAGWGVTWQWVQRTGASVKNPGRTASGGTAGYPHRILEMSYVVAGQPVVTAQSAWNWAAVKATYADWAAVKAAYANFEDLTANDRST